VPTLTDKIPLCYLHCYSESPAQSCTDWSWPPSRAHHCASPLPGHSSPTPRAPSRPPSLYWSSRTRGSPEWASSNASWPHSSRSTLRRTRGQRSRVRAAPRSSTRPWQWATEMGDWVIGNWKLIESTTITNYIWWLALLRVRVIGNVVDSITEPEKTNYNYFL